MRLLQRFTAQLLGEVAIRSLRSSLLISGAVLLLQSLGAWQYLASSQRAADMRLAAEHGPARAMAEQVLVVAIDDNAYQQFFDGQSPLRQDRVAQLLQTVATAAPQAQRIVVDLDLAPAGPTAASAALERVLLEHAPRWVLAAVPGATESDKHERTVWRERLCKAGVRLASPLVPTEFGQVRLTHQLSDSLSQVALAPGQGCVQPPARAAARPLAQIAAPLSPQALRDGLVLPFDGRLDVLAQHLQAISPQWIVLGGTWGKDDLFATPFGDRYGLHVHAAALAGQLQGQRQAPYAVQLLSAWLFVTLTALMLSVVSGWLKRVGEPPAELMHQMSGHQFFALRVLPTLLMCVVLVLMLAMAHTVGWLWGHTGWWLPSGSVGAVVLAAVLLIWDWGRAEIRAHAVTGQVWRQVFWEPVRADLASMRHAGQALMGRPGVDPRWQSASRGRLAFEALMALASLVLQTGLPLITLTATLLT